MKTVAVLLALFVCSGVSAQDWRDTLKMARSAYDKEHYEKALKYYEQAQRGAPAGVDLSDEMAQSAYKAEDYQRAEKIYQQSHGSKSGKKKRADNLHNIGNARMKTENYEGAVEAYKEALRLNPKDKETRYNLSEAKRELQKQKKKQQQEQENQQNGGDQQEQNDSGESGSDQNDSGQQNNSGQNSQQQNQGKGQQKNQGQGNQKKNGQQNSGQGQLSDKTADRMLEELMKKEAETKRRMSGGRGGGGSAKSGKDW